MRGRVRSSPLISASPAAAAPAKIVVNSRTGSVAMNREVRLDEVAIAHGNLSVTVSADVGVSQPAPFSAGQTAVVAQGGQVGISQEGGGLVHLPRGAKLADVVKALNTLRATPMDLISILQAMKASGALRAEIEVL